jgi:hypothetical protein
MPPNPWPPVPTGDCRSEDPDGVDFADSGWHSLYDTADRRPPIQSGDWQTRPPPMRERDRKPTV